MSRVVIIDREAVKPHEYDRNDTIEEVILTDRVKRVGSFAFSRCSRLRKITLSDSVTDFGDGVIRDLGSLREIEVTIRHGNYGAVKELLADSDAEMLFRLHIEDNSADLASEESRRRTIEVMLVFPAYISIPEENTMARQINFDIQGSGMGYREAVLRKGIKYRDYDSLFSKAAVDNTVLAAKIAVSRLLFPHELSDKSKAVYEEFLKSRTRDICLWLAGGKVLTRTEDKAMDLSAASVASEADPEAPGPGEPFLAEFTAADILGFLSKRGLIDGTQIESALRIAAGRHDAELSASLIEAGRRARGGIEDTASGAASSGPADGGNKDDSGDGGPEEFIL
ncbi:MAG: leucine-rich repeat protein [Lachnospiraceae bacterium]|nr:leucine-rich repeat protein [Lachnospiraceae bacterium]